MLLRRGWIVGRHMEVVLLHLPFSSSSDTPPSVFPALVKKSLVMLAESPLPGAGEGGKSKNSRRVARYRRIFDAWACIIALERKIKVRRTCSVTDDPSSMDANARISRHPPPPDTWKVARCINEKETMRRRRGATRSGGGDSTVISILGEREKRACIRPLYMYTGITRAPMGTRMYARGPFAPQALYTYSNWIIRATRRVDSKSFDGLASPKQASIAPLRARQPPVSHSPCEFLLCRPVVPSPSRLMEILGEKLVKRIRFAYVSKRLLLYHRTTYASDIFMQTSFVFVEFKSRDSVSTDFVWRNVIIRICSRIVEIETRRIWISIW